MSGNTDLLRIKLLEMYHSANAGHIACSLSCLDLLHVILLKAKLPKEDFILSKGHAALGLYVVLNAAGHISDEELATFYQDATKLPAHPAPNAFPEIPFATGSLGHGFPIGNGIAKANQLAKNDLRTFVLMSDGETNEGTTWEAAHFAVAHQLENLIVIIDKNNIQGFDITENVLGETAHAEKFRLIGFDVEEMDGHNLIEISETIEKLSRRKNKKPKMIIANTIKGKGVSFMENTVDWHYWPMSDTLFEKAMEEIKNS